MDFSKQKAEDWLDDLETVGNYAVEKIGDVTKDMPIGKSLGAIATNPTAQEIGAQIYNLGSAISESAREATKDPINSALNFTPMGIGTIENEAINIGKKIITDTPEFKAWFGDSRVVDKQGNPLILYHGTEDKIGNFIPNTSEVAKLYKEASSKIYDEYYEKTRPLFRIQDDAVKNGDMATRQRMIEETNKLAAIRESKIKNLGEAPESGTWEYKKAPEITKFAKNKLGSNTFGNATNIWYALTSKFGTWANTAKIKQFDRHMGLFYKIENPKEFDSLEDLATFIKTEFENNTGKILKWGDEIDLKDNNVSLNRGMKTVIGNLKKEGYDGISINDEEFGGKSYVAFDPTQIKSVNNRGTFDPKNPNILKSVVGGIGLVGTSMIAEDYLDK